jgi:hypothetical protein
MDAYGTPLIELLGTGVDPDDARKAAPHVCSRLVGDPDAAREVLQAIGLAPYEAAPSPDAITRHRRSG